METVDAEVISHTVAVGCDGLIVRNAAEAEKLLQTAEIGTAQTDGFLVGQPFCDLLVVGFAALGGTLVGNEDELHVIALGYFGAFVLAILDGDAASPTAHTPEVEH